MRQLAALFRSDLGSHTCVKVEQNSVALRVEQILINHHLEAAT